MLDWVLNTPQLIYNSSDYHAPLSHEKQKGLIELIKNELTLVKDVVAFFHIYNRNLFLSILVFFHLIFTNHRTAGEWGGQFLTPISTASTRFTDTQ